MLRVLCRADFNTLGRVLNSANISTYLDHILGQDRIQLPQLECPPFDKARYKRLVADAENSNTGIQYLFALDLRQSLSILHQLLGSIIEASRLLGSTHCALSIVEGNSDDGTADVLFALGPRLETLGIKYAFQSSSIDPSQGDRIGKLAQLRNLALEPLGSMAASNTTTVIFLNDVAICPDDILELVLERQRLGATMTCAMDWTYVGRDPTFYDVWVARGINGDSFFEIPADGNWNSAWNLFWNADEDTRARFVARRPFQVFSCWNGAVVFSAEAILGHGIRFRAPNLEKGECAQGEPQLFCKDLWFRGLGRITVVPAVNLEYSVERARQIKEAKGFTGANVGNRADDYESQIEWRPPPEKVKCIPTYENQFWQLWNETLA